MCYARRVTESRAERNNTDETSTGTGTRSVWSVWSVWSVRSVYRRCGTKDVPINQRPSRIDPPQATCDKTVERPRTPLPDIYRTNLCPLSLAPLWLALWQTSSRAFANTPRSRRVFAQGTGFGQILGSRPRTRRGPGWRTLSTVWMQGWRGKIMGRLRKEHVEYSCRRMRIGRRGVRLSWVGGLGDDRQADVSCRVGLYSTYS
jgi:hypothetical protein